MGRTKKGKKSPEPQDKPQKSHLIRFFQKRSASCSNVRLDTQAETPSWSAHQMADQVSQAAGSSGEEENCETGTRKAAPTSTQACPPSSAVTEPEPTASPCWESGDDWQLSPLHHTTGAIPVDDAGTSAQDKDDQPYSPVAPYIPEDSGIIHFESLQLKFFQDLSRNTLRQRRALKPILDLLKERSIKYRWGFPFALIVIKQGKSILIKSHKDIPYFLKALSLPPVAIENWDSLIWDSPQPRTGRNTASTSSRHSKDTDLTGGHDSPPKRRVLET
ncbi:hypothetical protein XELAEV_18013169mg [Xenopus laevis]|uniref:Uncharacterized protein n=1 Tax=Xenopus laevis TaxID=8355 RepID=A0A974DP30_XENLA|nr:hypothetical protein XELAEV_18013169mg [Xenopus laevis]